MIEIRYSSKFNKMYKKWLKQKNNYKIQLDRLITIIETLKNQGYLGELYKNHKLRNTTTNQWECHLDGQNVWLLVYKINGNEVELQGIVEHSELDSIEESSRLERLMKFFG